MAVGALAVVDLGMTFSGDQYRCGSRLRRSRIYRGSRRTTRSHRDYPRAWTISAQSIAAADLGGDLYDAVHGELVRRKLQEAGIEDEIELHIIEDDHGSLRWDLPKVPTSRSPTRSRGNALLIEAPHGRMFHTDDSKLDEDPIIGQPTTEEELTEIGDEGVLALVCDNRSSIPRRAGRRNGLRSARRVQHHNGKRVPVTTFASSIARLQTLGDVADRPAGLRGRALPRPDHRGVAGEWLLTDFPTRSISMQWACAAIC